MVKAATRETLLQAGSELMRAKGYNHTGLQEIVARAGVPKGSFYHFFPSKEAFGLEVLANYVKGFEPFMEGYLLDAEVAPLERLRRFFQAGRDMLATEGCQGGCFVGNLAQELADQEETFRLRLAEIMEGWQQRFESCLAEAQGRGELAPDTDLGEVGRFILDGWEGAILRMKVTRSIAPVDGFLHVLFGLVLRPA